MNTLNLETEAMLSCYKELTFINEEKGIVLVESTIDNKIYVKKEVSTRCYDIYHSLKKSPVSGAVKIHDLILTEDKLIVIEEFVNGELLSEVIKNTSLTLDETCSYFIKICETVKQLHKMNPPVIHRDIKASNIIIDNNNNPILLDFDISKFENKKSEYDTELMGSFGYAAPEQYGFGPSTTQTDIYTLGILLNAMLQNGNITRDLPYDSKLSGVVKKCINTSPSDRFKNIDDLIYAVRFQVFKNVPTYSFPNIKNIPGFRTKNLAHMLFSTLYFTLATLFISAMFSSEYKSDNSLYDCIGEAFLAFEVFILPMFFIFNYRNIWNIIPFAKSRNIFVKAFAICITYILTSFILIGILVLALSPLST